MAAVNFFEATEPTRAAVDALPGVTVLEFGTPWCGWCQAAIPLATAALARYPQARHIKIEDGSGRPLGRSFRIKLWPTFIFLRDGVEVGRVIRPGSVDAITQILFEIVD